MTYFCLMFADAPHRVLTAICGGKIASATRLSSGVKSAQCLYLIKSINTAIDIYSVTSKSLELYIYLSKSREVLVSKCT